MNAARITTLVLVELARRGEPIVFGPATLARCDELSGRMLRLLGVAYDSDRARARWSDLVDCRH